MIVEQSKLVTEPDRGHELGETAPRRAAASTLILSLVHPDFLPSVYSLAFVLRDAGLRVRIVSFSSPTHGSHDVGEGITLIDAGSYDGSFLDRVRARLRFRRAAAQAAGLDDMAAIIATCPFSYLEALRVRGPRSRIVYYMLETYDVRGRDLIRSPLTALRSRKALHRIAKADLLCTPSWERSGWLAGVAGLRTLPATVLNSPSYQASYRRHLDPHLAEALLPPGLEGRPLVIHTGGVSATQCVLELVESVDRWPARLGLVVTNVGANKYGDSVRRAASASPRREDIVLLPPVSRDQMLSIQRRGTVGICFLRSGDNMETVMPAPNKVGEYLHNGLIIVGLRMPYLQQLEVGGVAVLADDLRPTSIAAAVERAWRRAHEGEGSALALEAARTWYCMETQAVPILRLIQQGLSGNGQIT